MAAAAPVDTGTVNQDADMLSGGWDEYLEEEFDNVLSNVELGDNAAGAEPAADAGHASSVAVASVTQATAADPPAATGQGVRVRRRRAGKSEEELLLEQQLLEKKLELARLRRMSGQPSQGGVGHDTRVARDTVRITPKDVRLDTFSGNRDEAAFVLSPEYYLPLLVWLRKCLFALRTSRLDASLHVSVLIAALRGAAQNVFSQRFTAAEIASWSLEDAEFAIASLVPDYKAFFSRQAIDMRFSIRSLSNDIERFALLMRYGEIKVDGSALVFDWLQRKMLDACPEIFSIASSQFNKPFVFAPTFEAIVSAAHEIVNVLTSAGRLSPGSVKPRHESHVDTDSNVQARHKNPKPGNGKRTRSQDAGRGATKTLKRVDKAEWQRLRDLARQHGRCYGCGQKRDAADLARHRSKTVVQGKREGSCEPGENRANFVRNMQELDAQLRSQGLKSKAGGNAGGK